MKLTVKAKLLAGNDEKRLLLETMERFNAACNYISKAAFENKIFGKFDMQRLLYKDLRARFGLSSQFAVRAIGKVRESYKGRGHRESLHVFKEHSAVVYDQRILSFNGLSIASILTLDGRRKIPISFGPNFRLEQRRIRGQADLIYTKGEFYLCLVTELPAEPPIEPIGYLGVDLGIVNLATDSDCNVYSGEHVDRVRIKTQKLKKRLQSRGTKSAKRHLKKISGRERRFKRNTNHTISKRIVSTAKDTTKAIATEDLKGFRVTVRKTERDRFGKWAFYELRTFIEYKARLAGVSVVAVDPRNTSRTCSQCGYVAKGNRKSQSEFVCLQCKYSTNADFNAAVNIAARASVNAPIAAGELGWNPACSFEQQAAAL